MDSNKNVGKVRKVLLPLALVAAIIGVAVTLAGSYIFRLQPATMAAGGKTFRDCGDVGSGGSICPLLTTVPAGQFVMGAKDGEANEQPRHPVSIAKPLAVGVDLVTRGQYMACVNAGACTKPGKAEFHQDDSHPVVMVNFKDASDYVTWLGKKTGKAYRLPSEAEWEYFARAGSDASYPWGDAVGSKRADCGDCGSQWDNLSTAPVGSFPGNAFGLHDTVGNAWQWVADCYHDNYQGAPVDGSAWGAGSDCPLRSRRGGAWDESSHDSRSSSRIGVYATARNYDFGFRVVRTE